jgi:hypothetical protein
MLTPKTNYWILRCLLWALLAWSTVDFLLFTHEWACVESIIACVCGLFLNDTVWVQTGIIEIQAGTIQAQYSTIKRYVEMVNKYDDICGRQSSLNERLRGLLDKQREGL